MDNNTPTAPNRIENYGRVAYLLRAVINGEISKEYAEKRLNEIEAKEEAQSAAFLSS